MSFCGGNQSKASYNPLFEMKYNFLNYYKKEELINNIIDNNTINNDTINNDTKGDDSNEIN